MSQLKPIPKLISCQDTDDRQTGELLLNRQFLGKGDILEELKTQE